MIGSAGGRNTPGAILAAEGWPPGYSNTLLKKKTGVRSCAYREGDRTSMAADPKVRGMDLPGEHHRPVENLIGM